jgi:hypothetical protein
MTSDDHPSKIEPPAGENEEKVLHVTDVVADLDEAFSWVIARLDRYSLDAPAIHITPVYDIETIHNSDSDSDPAHPQHLSVERIKYEVSILGKLPSATAKRLL